MFSPRRWDRKCHLCKGLEDGTEPAVALHRKLEDEKVSRPGDGRQPRCRDGASSSAMRYSTAKAHWNRCVTQCDYQIQILQGDFARIFDFELR
jgi:hypothetical protein